MEFVGQAVPDRNAGVFGQLLDDRLSETPVFDPVVHPAQDPGGIADRLLVAHLGAGRVEVGHVGALVIGAVSKAQRVRVEAFSKISTIFLPFSRCCSVPA